MFQKKSNLFNCNIYIYIHIYVYIYITYSKCRVEFNSWYLAFFNWTVKHSWERTKTWEENLHSNYLLRYETSTFYKMNGLSTVVLFPDHVEHHPRPLDMCFMTSGETTFINLHRMNPITAPGTVINTDWGGKFITPVQPAFFPFTHLRFKKLVDHI